MALYSHLPHDDEMKFDERLYFVFIRILTLMAIFCSFSCGLETVKTLDSPSTDYLNNIGVTSLSVTNTLAGTEDFQGYEVYYKLYTASSTASNITKDYDYLTNYGATKDMLYSLGYRRLNLSLSQRTSEPNVNLVYYNANNSSTKVTVDFTNFINKTTNSSTNDKEPILSVTGVTPVSFYRGVTNSDGSYQKFTDLYPTAFVYSADMDSNITSKPSQYEVCFFILSYAWSLDGTIYSKPVPWGIVRFYSN